VECIVEESTADITHVDGYDFNLILHDVFMLTRIFTPFSKTKRPMPRTSCDSFGIPKNVVVITGGMHTRIYINLFKKLFGIDPLVSNSNKKGDIISQCLQLNKPFNFWGSVRNILATKVHAIDPHIRQKKIVPTN
jgi:hypothetical protein